MTFLKNRYYQIHSECIARGFRVNDFRPNNLPKDADIWKDYIPTEKAIQENRDRIRIRMPSNPRFISKK